MSAPKTRGRTAVSRNVRITPELREHPDVEKLTRVLLALAVKKAEQSEGGNAMT